MARITKKIVTEYIEFIGHGPMVWREMVEFVREHAPGYDPIAFARDIALDLRHTLAEKGVRDEPLIPQALYLTICMLTTGFRDTQKIVDDMGTVFRALCEREKVYASDVIVYSERTGDPVMSVQKAAETWLEQPAT